MTFVERAAVERVLELELVSGLGQRVLRAVGDTHGPE
jgi:hypothetical protein